MKLNLPTKLTIFRILLIPICLVLMLVPSIPHRYLLALAVFVIASFTDYLDGYLARRDNLITNFGKFLDPLADKVLVFSILLAMVELSLCGSITIIIMLTREFFVTSIRLVCSAGGKVIAANIWGKLKTVTQIVVIIVIFLMQELIFCGILPADFPSFVIAEILLWIATAASVISGITYFTQNKQELDFTK